MSSFKKLNKADVTTVDYSANKRWNLAYTSSISSSHIINYIGTNEPFNITGSTTSYNQYRSLIYSSINHLFYQSYSGSLLNTGSIMFNLNTYESASQQRPTASYFNYNSNPLLIKQFPTGSGETISILNIDQNIYGSKVLPYSFQISSSGLLIKDDGYGNLYDISGVGDDYIDLRYLTVAIVNGYFDDLTPGQGIQLVGNIFYAHGIAVITNQSSSYQQFSTASILFQNEHTIYENEVRCIVRESDFNLSYNPTLLKYGGQYITTSGSSYTLTGSFDSTVKDFVTGSFFQPYVTAIGLYNDENELLMVAKLGKPIVLSSDTDMTFIVKYDN
jgi:hypothetical protein